MADRPVSAEMHPGPGFRIRNSIERADTALCKAFGTFETPDISDQINRLYTMTHNIKNQVNDLCFSGPAVTVKVFPGDNLMLHKALDMIQPGDVIIVDAGSSTENAVIGDLVASKAKHRGVTGIIVDGLVRDLPALKEVGLPIYAKGVSAIGPLHRGPGELNFSVSCGGIVVNPGDIIIADSVGVVVVRKDFAEDLLRRLKSTREQLWEYEQAVKRGEFNNAWVDKLLEASGCHIDDDDSY